jgi:hypothetical protein
VPASDQLEQVRTTATDLRWLREEWDEEIDDDSLRRSSSVLRRLLVDGELGRSWRTLGLDKQPIITAPSLEAFLKGVPILMVEWAQAGGARYHGMEVSGTLEFAGLLPPRKLDDPTRSFSLKKFLESSCVVTKGTLISRRVLVKYVANKLGGVHSVDSSRSRRSPDERGYQALDGIRGVYKVADKDSLYFELLSIGQCLASSPDVEGLLERAKFALKEA